MTEKYVVKRKIEEVCFERQVDLQVARTPLRWETTQGGMTGIKDEILCDAHRKPRRRNAW